jgi:integrase
MTVEHVEVLVEEPSMEATLEVLLPKMLANTIFRIHTHQGKLDLLDKLPAKQRGYFSWIPATWRIVVVVDRDNDDCEDLKRQLEESATQANLPTRSTTKGSAVYVVVNRLAIEALEAWYFGDWKAVCAAYPRVPSTIPAKAGYRAPDKIKGGTWEAFLRVLQEVGYFTTGLRKIEAARAIAEHMVPARNTSPSFCALRDALDEMSA